VAGGNAGAAGVSGAGGAVFAKDDEVLVLSREVSVGFKVIF